VLGCGACCGSGRYGWQNQAQSAAARRSAILKRVSLELSQLMRLKRPLFLTFIECAPIKRGKMNIK
jgi:hypothetical protein